jgi:asparagine synthase (glutamine-hydrolysing)
LKTDGLHTFTFGIPNSDDARLAKELAPLAGAVYHFVELRPDYLIEVAENAVRITEGMQSCIHMHAFANVDDLAHIAPVVYKGLLGETLLHPEFDDLMWADYDDTALSDLWFKKQNDMFSLAEQGIFFSADFSRDLGNSVLESFQHHWGECNASLVANRIDQWNSRHAARRFSVAGVELVRSRVIARTPFCDNDLVEYVMSMPPGLRNNFNILNKLFAKYFQQFAKIPYEATGYPLVPCARDLAIRFREQVIWRARAAGLKFILPRQQRPYAKYAHWMRTSLSPWLRDILLSQRSLQRGYFQPEQVKELVQQHANGSDHSRKLGLLLAIELWHRQFID